MSKIWFRDYTVEELNKTAKGELAETLDMEYTEIGDDFLTMKMPVNHKTRQGFGIVHGGALAALIEQVASYAGYICLNPETQGIVGLDLNCNHLKGTKDGFVHATARPYHIGRTTQVWEVKIVNDNGDLINTGRMTMYVLNK